MVAVELKNLPDSEVELAGELPAETLLKFRPVALTKLGAEIKLPGFRPGQVPEAILEKQLGEERILWQMAELALKEWYPKIIEEQKLDPIGRPEIIITKLASGNPLGFKIKTALAPNFTLPDYQAIAKELNKTKPVTPEDKEKQRITLIDALLEKTIVPIPKVLVEYELDRMLESLKADLGVMGIKFADYLAKIKKTEAELRAEWPETAKKRININFLLGAIAKQEKLEPTPEKVLQFLENLV